MESREKIKRLRIEKGITQKELADRLGVSQNAVYNWENGKRAIKADTLQKIADIFCVPSIELLDDKMVADYFIGDAVTKDFKEKALYMSAKDNYYDVLKGTVDQLNDDGKGKVLSYAVDLSDNPKYRNDSDN